LGSISLATVTNVIFAAIWALPRVDVTHGGCHFAIVIAALVVVSFKFKSIVATVIVVAFVVAFDEPMKPFGSFVATLLPFSCLTIVSPSLPQEVQLQRSKFNQQGASSSTMEVLLLQRQSWRCVRSILPMQLLMSALLACVQH